MGRPRSASDVRFSGRVYFHLLIVEKVTNVMKHNFPCFRIGNVFIFQGVIMEKIETKEIFTEAEDWGTEDIVGAGMGGTRMQFHYK
jgi:hypothetical protein